MVDLEYLHKFGGRLYNYYSFRDLSTYTPVAGKTNYIRNKAYYNNPLIQESDLLQPTALATGFNGKPCASFDGLGQCMVSKYPLPASRTNILTVVVVFQNKTASLVDGQAKILLELSSNTNSVQTGFYIDMENLSGNTVNGLYAAMRGNVGFNGTSYNSYFVNENQILIVEFNKTVNDPQVNLIKNNVQITRQGGALNKNTNAFGDHYLYVGARNQASFPFYGLVSDIAVIEGAITPDEETAISRMFANEIGIELL